MFSKITTTTWQHLGDVVAVTAAVRACGTAEDGAVAEWAVAEWAVAERAAVAPARVAARVAEQNAANRVRGRSDSPSAEKLGMPSEGSGGT